MGLLNGAERANAHTLQEHQRSAWRRQVDYVARSSKFYSSRWSGVTPPEDLDHIGRLPLVDKEDLRAAQRELPPFGSYLAASSSMVTRVHRTGGTTGEAMNLALSASDARTTATVGARSQSASGLGPDDVVIHCLNYQLWMGGFTDHTTLEATGATVVPFGVGNPRLLIRTIQELGVTAISCTPSYPAVLAQVLAEDGIDPRSLGLRLGLFGGEAALDVPGFRERLEETWGIAARNSNYGVTDVMCNFAGQCTEQNDLHFMGLDVLYPEIIEPASGQSLMWEPSTRGELVLTHLERDCQPLVRFRTGDIVELTAIDTCVCGRTAPRFRVIGRADDMVVVRGVNVFPTSVAALINGDAELTGEYRITLAGPGPYDRLSIEVEAVHTPSNPEQARAHYDQLAERIAVTARRDLRVTAQVTVVANASLPRTEGKTRRVVRS